jgi:hypothetical protein
MTAEDRLYRIAAELADDLDITVEEAAEKIVAKVEECRDWTVRDLQLSILYDQETLKELEARNLSNIGDLSDADWAKIKERAKRRYAGSLS